MASTYSSLLAERKTLGQQNDQHGNPEEPMLFDFEYDTGHNITNSIPPKYICIVLSPPKKGLMTPV